MSGARKPTRAKALGVTHEDYTAMLTTQGGVCAICGRPPGTTRKLDVDHDHKTGKVRGLLCWTCNHFILGKYSNATKLRAAADYLDAHAS